MTDSWDFGGVGSLKANSIEVSNPPAATSRQMESNSKEAAKLNDEKESKLRKLRQMTAVQPLQVQAQADHVTKSNDKKCEVASMATDNRKIIEDMLLAIKELNKKCEHFEARVTDVDFKQKELLKKIGENDDAVVGRVMEINDELRKLIKTSNEERMRADQELERVINLREKKLSLIIQSEVNDEASARSLVANDVGRLADHVKEIKVHMLNDISNLQSGLTLAQSKYYQEFDDVRELIAMEKSTRERSVTAIRSDFYNRQNELQQGNEALCAEVSKETKAAFSQLTLLVENLRANSAKDTENAQNVLVSFDAKHQKRMDEIEEVIEQRVAEITNSIDRERISVSNNITTISDQLLEEKADRTTEDRKILEEMAAEHLRRERDESAIINVFENFLSQSRGMDNWSGIGCD